MRLDWDRELRPLELPEFEIALPREGDETRGAERGLERRTEGELREGLGATEGAGSPAGPERPERVGAKLREGARGALTGGGENLDGPWKVG